MCGIWFYIQKNKITTTQYDLLLEKYYNIRPRGPDDSKLLLINDQTLLGFHRLSINDVSEKGDQPFIRKNGTRNVYLICNGEIYNSKELAQRFSLYLDSTSDCETIIELYLLFGIQKTLSLLKGVFAGIIIEYDMTNKTVHMFSFRDRLGIRPLFYAISENGLCLSSEIKGLPTLSADIKSYYEPFPPGNYSISTFKYNQTSEISLSFKQYWSIYNLNKINCVDEIGVIHENIRNRLETSVIQRMQSDRPICCLLSGGLDSSLISALVSKNTSHPVHTFSIGFEGGTDFMYAKMVADHIKSIHTEVIITKDEALESIEHVIKLCETYDTTTIRASVWQYLLCKYISEKTDFKVVMMGDGSDELCGGYIYFNKSPNSTESHTECQKLLSEIHHFDVLRADRAVACSGLETRVPFLDSDFVEYYMSIHPDIRFPRDESTGENKIEKYLLRQSFASTDILPNEVLWRKKEAFSDGTSSKEDSWFTLIQKYIQEKFGMTENDFYKSKIYENYKNKCDGNFIHYWLPNSDWVGNVTDPSARMLTHY